MRNRADLSVARQALNQLIDGHTSDFGGVADNGGVRQTCATYIRLIAEALEFIWVRPAQRIGACLFGINDASAQEARMPGQNNRNAAGGIEDARWVARLKINADTHIDHWN